MVLNMKYFLNTLILVFLSALGIAQESGRIELTVDAIPSDQGQIRAALFDSPEGFPDKITKGKLLVSSDVTNGESELVFSDVPFGEYVLAVFHDENNNGQLDTNKRGIPLEALGVSNNVKLKLGPPKYDKALFRLSDSVNAMAISLQQYNAGK